MDIYNFIENEEQREYLLNKHYEFTAVEAAYVVCNSNRAIKEKHDAIDYIVVNGRFCPQSVRSFCPVVAGFNAGTYKVPACVL